jgi:transcriptional regulator with XRE-family HTH domain
MAKAPLWVHSEVDVRVGPRIRSRRLLMGWSKDDLLSRVALHSGTLCQIESGVVRPSAGELYDIAKALNATISYFFHSDDDAQ